MYLRTQPKTCHMSNVGIRVVDRGTLQVEENLVMSTADDFRERSETYQLVQSAIPANEKCSSEG